MNKKVFARFDEERYEDVLDNGLKVFINYKPLFKTSSAALGTGFGGLDICQKVGDQVYEFNPGVAHFLEHKLFENEDLNIMNRFSAMGANVNAFTSYDETVYYFTTTGDIREPLDALIDFVLNFHIDEASVEKEKGIIDQELLMYLERPLSRMVNETYKAMYHNYPLKYDIGGSVDTVAKISLDELNRCYEFNYHPSNLMLVVTTNQDPEMIMEQIKRHPSLTRFKEKLDVKTISYQEPKSVVERDVRVRMNLNTKKACYGIKLDLHDPDTDLTIRKEWAIRMLLEMGLTPLNPDYQRWIDEELINDFFGFDIDVSTEHSELLFYKENDDASVLKEFIDNILKDLKPDQAKLKQLKRRHIADAYHYFNDIDEYSTAMIRDLLSDTDIFKTIEIIEKIELEDLIKYYQEIDFGNYVLVTIE